MGQSMQPADLIQPALVSRFLDSSVLTDQREGKALPGGRCGPVAMTTDSEP